MKKPIEQKKNHLQKSEISIISITGLMVLLVLIFIAFNKELINTTKSSKTLAQNKTHKQNPQKETEYTDIKNLLVKESDYVRYEESKDEFSTNTYRRISLLTSDTAPALLIITIYSNAISEIQLVTKNVIFPDDTTENMDGMKVSVTYKFDNIDRAEQAFWHMNMMRYKNAWYQGEHIRFLDEATKSEYLSIRLDKSGDVYRFNLTEAKKYFAKI